MDFGATLGYSSLLFKAPWLSRYFGSPGGSQLSGVEPLVLHVETVPPSNLALASGVEEGRNEHLGTTFFGGSYRSCVKDFPGPQRGEASIWQAK